MAFTYTFPDVIVVSGLNKNIGGSTDLAKKRDGSTDFYTPIHPPLKLKLTVLTQIKSCWHCYQETQGFQDYYAAACRLTASNEHCLTCF